MTEDGGMPTSNPRAQPIDPVSPVVPPSPGEIGWVATITVAKAAVIALAVDAFINSGSPRYRGQGSRRRAIGYTGGLLVAPVAWRLRGRRDPYPRALDLAVTMPLLVDAGGNAIGLYQNAHVDDLIHFSNGAVAAAVVGALATLRVRTAWEAAGIAVATGGTVAALWEIAEWTGMKLGAKGMDLTYDDTMEDLIETIAGSVVGGVITLLRHPTRLRNVPGTPGDPVVRSPAGDPR
jgi:hypothetical protein